MVSLYDSYVIHMQVCCDGAHHKLLGTWPQSSSRFNLTRHQLWSPLHFSKAFRLQYMVSTFSLITTKLNLLTGLLAAGNHRSSWSLQPAASGFMFTIGVKAFSVEL